MVGLGLDPRNNPLNMTNQQHAFHNAGAYITHTYVRHTSLIHTYIHTYIHTSCYCIISLLHVTTTCHCAHTHIMLLHHITTSCYYHLSLHPVTISCHHYVPSSLVPFSPLHTPSRSTTTMIYHHSPTMIYHHSPTILNPPPPPQLPLSSLPLPWPTPLFTLPPCPSCITAMLSSAPSHTPPSQHHHYYPLLKPPPLPLTCPTPVPYPVVPYSHAELSCCHATSGPTSDVRPGDLRPPLSTPSLPYPSLYALPPSL